jgi:hypothetical protein
MFSLACVEFKIVDNTLRNTQNKRLVPHVFGLYFMYFIVCLPLKGTICSMELLAALCNCLLFLSVCFEYEN